MVYMGVGGLGLNLKPQVFCHEPPAQVSKLLIQSLSAVLRTRAFIIRIEFLGASYCYRMLTVEYKGILSLK